MKNGKYLGMTKSVNEGMGVGEEWRVFREALLIVQKKTACASWEVDR